MYLKSKAVFATASALVLGAACAARADVTISSDATANMSCAAGVCQPTAADAVLNVTDLQTLLASGNVTVTTAGAGVQANNIAVTASLGWSANTMTLDAYQSISVSAPVAIKGPSGLSILTNDGGSGGELAFFGKGHVTFKKLTASLSIDGTAYKLVDSIAGLASAIRKSPAGNFALASDYDASHDGTYNNSPIAATSTGTVEGLGNRITNLSIYVPNIDDASWVGLFTAIAGRISDLGVVESSVEVGHVKNRKGAARLGILAGRNGGVISRCYSSGTISGPKYTFAGGLVSDNEGVLTESHSSAKVLTGIGSPGNISYGGGLVGANNGQISLSYATGNVASSGEAGSLVGDGAGGSTTNSYATGNVNGRGGVTGGLFGMNTADIAEAFSIGRVSGKSTVGGFIGSDGSQAGSLSNDYWDTDTSNVSDPSQGAGTPANDPGITGLTTEQLQSSLPVGFDPTIWSESSDINNGLPYLLGNPPE